MANGFFSNVISLRLGEFGVPVADFSRLKGLELGRKERGGGEGVLRGRAICSRRGKR